MPKSPPLDFSTAATRFLTRETGRLACMKRQYFGTDGIRGPYGSAVMNEDFAWRLGVAAARWLAGKGNPSGEILIGRDTRASGVALTQALADGFAHEGFTPVTLNVLPTPAVSRAVRTRDAVLGVVVTASHNPATDNGIKFFGADGVKLTDQNELAIEALLPAAGAASAIPATLGSLEAITEYLSTMSRVLDARLDGWKLVLDTAHGATVHTSGAVFRAHGAEVIAIGADPDGSNINANVGSEHPDALCAAVREHGARLGIAHDGDGDRCILCDEKGDLLDGDEIMTILALHALAGKRLRHHTLVATVQSNLGVDAALQAAGGHVVRTPVGDRYVIERMLAGDFQLGGESSGHIICADVAPTGDGLVAALKILSVMVSTRKPLSELRRGLVKFPQGTRALQVREKRPMETLAALPVAIAALEGALGSRGRVLVRYSGTEPKLRLLVEGPTSEVVESGLARLESAARLDLEVL